MDLAIEVLPMPSPLDPAKVKEVRERPLTEPLNHLKDAEELKEKIAAGVWESVFYKYHTAMVRAPYLAVQQLHVLQLRFLQALKIALDKDSNKNMSASALLKPPESQIVPQITHVDSDDEVPLGTDDL